MKKKEENIMKNNIISINKKISRMLSESMNHQQNQFSTKKSLYKDLSELHSKQSSQIQKLISSHLKPQDILQSDPNNTANKLKVKNAAKNVNFSSKRLIKRRSKHMSQNELFYGVNEQEKEQQQDPQDFFNYGNRKRFISSEEGELFDMKEELMKQNLNNAGGEQRQSRGIQNKNYIMDMQQKSLPHITAKTMECETEVSDGKIPLVETDLSGVPTSVIQKEIQLMILGKQVKKTQVIKMFFKIIPIFRKYRRKIYYQAKQIFIVFQAMNLMTLAILRLIILQFEMIFHHDNFQFCIFMKLVILIFQ